MDIYLSRSLMNDLSRSLEIAVAKGGAIDILRLASEIRLRNEVENVALEDIVAQLMLKARRFNVAMEFDTPDDFDGALG